MSSVVTAVGVDHYVTADMEASLHGAAQAIRVAITATEAAAKEAEGGSDAEGRCLDAIEQLEVALYHLEWEWPETGAH
jgi:hypothetical protein